MVQALHVICDVSFNYLKKTSSTRDDEIFRQKVMIEFEDLVNHKFDLKSNLK